MSDEITKTYANNDLTIVWKPGMCIHSTKCWKGLPTVFQPRNKPWITLDGAKADEILAQVKQCPSGALSLKDEDVASASADIEATVKPNGPVLVKGTVKVTLADGSIEEKGPVTAFCRCGASAKKPYCDGSHAKIGFEG